MTTFQIAYDRLIKGKKLEYEHALALVEGLTYPGQLESMRSLARERTTKLYGRKIFLRALIEISNVCVQNCYYCGLRRDNQKLERYRLSPDEILATVDEGLELGFGTIVLQGGEDPAWTQGAIVDLIDAIRSRSQSVAITLSLGVRPKEDYQAFKKAGADRYLLRHESADSAHFAELHPAEQKFAERAQALNELKELGYVVGAGMMIGSPGQKPESLAQDLIFLQEIQPQMVGIGPFIAQTDTPFGRKRSGSLEQTYGMISLVRLLLPKALLPATTAVSSLVQRGRIDAVLSGANVVMPNLSPPYVRDQYAIYDHKLSVKEESAEGLKHLIQEMATIGYEASLDRGDPIL